MPLVACEDVRTPLGALRVVFGIGHFQILCRAARAAPEGYTVSIGNTSAVYPVQYDVLKDFKAVWLLPTARFAQPSQHGRRAARHVLCWSGWRHSEGPQNISGLPQGLAGRPAAGWRCGRLSARASRRRNA